MLSDNRIGPEALKTLTAAIATAGSVTELNLSNNNLTASGTDLSGVQASHPSHPLHPLHPLQAAPISLACRRLAGLGLAARVGVGAGAALGPSLEWGPVRVQTVTDGYGRLGAKFGRGRVRARRLPTVTSGPSLGWVGVSASPATHAVQHAAPHSALENAQWT